MKKIIVLLMSFITTACVTGYNPTYWFNEVQAVNLSGSTIEDISIRVVDSEKTLSCSKVANYAMCDDRFGSRRYPQLGIEMSWTHPDGRRLSEVLTPSIPVTFNAAFALRIVMEIREDGTVKPFFEQDEPGRDGFILGG